MRSATAFFTRWRCLPVRAEGMLTDHRAAPSYACEERGGKRRLVTDGYHILKRSRTRTRLLGRPELGDAVCDGADLGDLRGHPGLGKDGRSCRCGFGGLVVSLWWPDTGRLIPASAQRSATV